MSTTILTPPHRLPDPVPARSNEPLRWAAIVRESRWILASAVVGFAVSAVGSQALELRRAWVVLILALSVTGLAVAYVRAHELDVLALVRQRLWWAAVRGIAMGMLLVLLLLPHDPTPTATGGELAASVVWLGVVYGAAEALLVNVLPMMAAWRAFQAAGWTASWTGKVAAAAFTMSANLLVTVAYNLGFPEFRGAEIAGPAGSNALIGLGFVLAPNPVISIISHVILHIASVLAGTDGPVNLPPHS
jgi:hypothetical protein